MLDTPLESVDWETLTRFIADKLPEGKRIDYKRATYGNADSDKKELLKDVSSFANSDGGLLFLGIDEEGGMPTDITGLSVNDSDQEILRLEQVIRDGVEPRIDVRMHAVRGEDGRTVLLMKIPSSVLAPHRVVFRGQQGGFWARSSAGKHEMDTTELRQAFLLSETIYDRIDQFRRTRVHRIARGATPVPMRGRGRAILHLVPVSAFRTRSRFDIEAMEELSVSFPPVGETGGWGHRFTLDGIVTYGGGVLPEGCRSYTQFFRDGCVEAVISDVAKTHEKQGDVLISEGIEDMFLDEPAGLGGMLIGLAKSGIVPPIWCMLSLTGISGTSLYNVRQFQRDQHRVAEDRLLIPEAVISQSDAHAKEILQPLFGLMWNAFGKKRPSRQ